MSSESNHPLKKNLRYRQKQRQRNHDQEAGQPEVLTRIPDHPLISRQPAELIDTDIALAELIVHLREHGSFAFDTEFIGELSFYPKLCLIQVATTEQVALIDPLAEIDLTPFWELIADPAVQKLVHAGLQDLEPVARLLDKTPSHIFDTQIASGFVGQLYPSSLANLVKHYCNVNLAKGATFTAWDRRPLSPSQHHYASDDVRYLPAIHDMIVKELDECGYGDWAQQECMSTLEQMATYRPNLDAQYNRVRGTRSLKRRDIAVVRALVQWRYDLARQEDMPPRSVLPDETLVALAKKRPTDLQAMYPIRHMPRPVVDAYGKTLIQVVQEASDLSKDQLPKADPDKPNSQQQIQIDSLWSMISSFCRGRGVDPALVTSRQMIVQARHALTNGGLEKDHPLAQGWRQVFIGDMLADFMAGKSQITLSWEDGKIQSQTQV